MMSAELLYYDYDVLSTFDDMFSHINLVLYLLIYGFHL